MPSNFNHAYFRLLCSALTGRLFATLGTIPKVPKRVKDPVKDAAVITAAMNKRTRKAIKRARDAQWSTLFNPTLN